MYPRLGSKVSFVRGNPHTNEIEHGTGLVMAICLDTALRPMAHIEALKSDGEKDRFNVDLLCVNPSDEQVEKYTATVNAVKALQSEGNDKVASMVAEYNGRVSDAYTGVVGDPVVLDIL